MNQSQRIVERLRDFSASDGYRYVKRRASVGAKTFAAAIAEVPAQFAPPPDEAWRGIFNRDTGEFAVGSAMDFVHMDLAGSLNWGRILSFIVDVEHRDTQVMRGTDQENETIKAFFRGFTIYWV